MLLLRSAVLSLLVVALSSLVGNAPAQAMTASAYGSEAVHATNAVRSAHHLRRLHSDACLQRRATAQAARMARQRRMFHQDIVTALRVCHLQSVGENVAVGYPSGRAAVRQGWMQSPPHRANVLHRGYRLLAVSARQGADGRWYASQVFGRR